MREAVVPLERVQSAIVAAAGGPSGCHLAPLGVEEARARTAAAAARAVPGPSLLRVEDLTVDGPAGPVPVRRYSDRAEPAGAVVYLHSGGWVLGDLDGCDHVVRRLARATGLEYWSVDYRRAPEHAAPAALDDARAVLDHVREGGRPVALHGESAGGALAAVLSQEAGPSLRLAVLVYPVTDGDLERPSYSEHAESGVLTTADMRWFWDLYAPGRDRLDPGLSPLRGNVAASCPTYVVVAGHDPLRDEGVAYARQLAAHGRLVGLERFDDCMHGFFGLQGRSPRADGCLASVSATTSASFPADL